jgi:Uma2 family endonuclease
MMGTRASLIREEVRRLWERPAGDTESPLPDLLIEARSPSDRTSDVLSRAGAYLEAGIPVVCFIDRTSGTAYIFSADEPPRVVAATTSLR